MNTITRYIKHFIDLILDIPKEVKWFIQRGKRGWADCDAWGYYDYNARVNVAILRHLKKIKHGIPNAMFDYDEPRNPTDAEEEIAEKKWNAILDDMIFAFDQVVREGDDLIRWYENRTDNHWADFIKKYPDTKLQTKEEYDRMKHGMALFVEHYFSLWD